MTYCVYLKHRVKDERGEVIFVRAETVFDEGDWTHVGNVTEFVYDDDDDNVTRIAEGVVCTMKIPNHNVALIETWQEEVPEEPDKEK